MRHDDDNKPTRWMLFKCGGGSRWSSTREDDRGRVCDFSGCGCGTRVEYVKTTENRAEAGAWFQRPTAARGA